MNFYNSNNRLGSSIKTDPLWAKTVHANLFKRKKPNIQWYGKNPLKPYQGRYPRFIDWE